jgi:hypothetical protein
MTVHLHSPWGHEEPEILRHSNRQFGPIGADAGQFARGHAVSRSPYGRLPVVPSSNRQRSVMGATRRPPSLTTALVQTVNLTPAPSKSKRVWLKMPEGGDTGAVRQSAPGQGDAAVEPAAHLRRVESADRIGGEHPRYGAAVDAAVVVVGPAQLDDHVAAPGVVADAADETAARQRA